MGIRKKIELDDWQNRFQALTSGNSNRNATIAIDESRVVKQKTFEFINYDPLGKGNNIMITLNGFSHTINNPVEVYMEERDNGVLASLELVDENDTSTFLKLYQ